MGLVVQFAVRPSKARPEKSDRPCEVTIFPGVRYDRRPNGAAAIDVARRESERPVARRPEETAR
jgi:hypothetical protein